MQHTETCSQRDALCSSGSVIWRIDLIIVLIFIHLTPTTTNEQSIYTVSNYCTCSNRTWEGKGRQHDSLTPAWMFAWRQQCLLCASAHYDHRVCSSNYCVYGRKTYQFVFRKKWFKYTRLKHSSAIYTDRMWPRLSSSGVCTGTSSSCPWWLWEKITLILVSIKFMSWMCMFSVLKECFLHNICVCQ